MLVSDFAMQNGINLELFERFALDSRIAKKGFFGDLVFNDNLDDSEKILENFAEYCERSSDSEAKQWVENYKRKYYDKLERERLLAEAEAKKQRAMASMLITSGFNFDGYKIVKYSGYISGDDAIQVDRESGFLGLEATNVGQALTDSLVKIRRQALKELKEAAYDLGCNAVIGVDFDYLTLDPEVNGLIKGTTRYLPYVFCVTANGNAVIIEKDDSK